LLTVPLFLISSLFDAASAGHFALTQKIIAAPIYLISNATSQVLLGSAPKLKHDHPQELQKLYRKTAAYLAAIVAIITPILLLSPWIFPLIFGSRWQYAGVLTACSIPLLIGTLLVSPINFLQTIEGSRQIVALNLYRLLLSAGGFWLSARCGLSCEMSLSIFSTITFAIYGIVFIMNCQYVDRLAKASPTTTQTY
jgi:hypothetical protein